MNFSEIENKAKQIKIDKAAIDHAKILADAEAALKTPENITSAKQKPSIWRTIMNNKITKLAIAAVIIIAATLTINHFGTSIDGSTVAWADIAERVQQIQTCFFKAHTTMTGGPLGEKTKYGEMEMYTSSEYGFRNDMYTDCKLEMNQYLIPAEKTMITVIPASKQYIKMTLTDELLKQYLSKGGDPRQMVEKMVSGNYKNIGEAVIDGIKVEGIETTDPNASGGQFEKYTARCWVDIETQMPVLLEMEVEIYTDPNTSPMKMSMQMDSFQWDIDLGPEIFEPNIPEDYELLSQMQFPEQTEAAAVKGLQTFAEISDGKYPTKLATMQIMQEFTKIIMNKHQQKWLEKQETDPNFKPTKEEKQQVRKDMMPQMMAVQGAGMFYATLIQENKKPAYYGDKVTADDIDLPLLRWQLQDGSYRVIYGDLSCETVTPDQLTELEAQLPQE